MPVSKIKIKYGMPGISKIVGVESNFKTNKQFRMQWHKCLMVLISTSTMVYGETYN